MASPAVSKAEALRYGHLSLGGDTKRYENAGAVPVACRILSILPDQCQAAGWATVLEQGLEESCWR